MHPLIKHEIPDHSIHIIGAGGGGSWLVPILTRIVNPQAITVWDGDVLEPKNLDRQLYSPDDVGKNKARALAARYPGINAVPAYFTPGCHEPLRGDWLFSCADNDPARKAVLETIDNYRCQGVIAANEYTDAEAYYYHFRMRGTPNDPRVFYPGILTNTADDPTRPRGCLTDAALADNPQLVIFNIDAVVLAAKLYWFHTRGEAEEIDQQWHPVHFISNTLTTRTIKFGDRAPAVAA